MTLLAFALVAGGTAGYPGTVSAAPTLPDASAVGATGLRGGDGDRVVLTDGGGRHPSAKPSSATPSSTMPPSAKPPSNNPSGGRSGVNPNGNGLYIVQLAEAPVTTYSGGVPGLAGTRPQQGQRLEPESTAAQAYRRHLDATRAAVVAAAGVTTAEVYTTAFNGFSAKLTARQVATLRADKRVRAVTASQKVASAAGTPAPETTGLSSAPTSLALTTPVPSPPPPTPPASTAPTQSNGGSGTILPDPRKLGSPRFGTPKPAAPKAGAPKPGGATGTGMVIGVLDTGIWPDSPSFAKQMPAPANWHGACQTGPMWVAADCNGKIVGARYFADAYLAGSGGTLPAGEVLSPVDLVGHGTHTASTAAGLPVQHVTIDGRDFGSIAGVAPDAQIAVYKVLWGGAGYDADIIAGIDAAIADGVQVLNFSVAVQLGDWTPNTPVGTAFLNAVLAGIFVSAAAGNDGLTGTISNAAPWLTTVGAAVTKLDEGTVRLGDGTKLVGGTLDVLPGGDTASPLVFGAQAGPVAGSAEYCLPGTLDAAKVRGKVVACALYSPFDEVAELKAKGATAMLLFDPPIGNFRVNSIYGFPVLYLNTAQQAGQLFTYLTNHPTDGTALLSPGGDGSSVPGLPSVADFSSKGPDYTAPGVLKPDLVAPGSDIVASVSPPGNFGRQFDAYSGTSMATPYVAGAATILAAEHPSWSPGTISSALSTTATDTEGTSDPLYQGSGLVDLARAGDPGLVFEPDPADFVAFSQQAKPDGAELNLPSISLHEYDGTQPVTLTRKLTNVGTARETYRASVTGLPGMQVTVNPSSVTVFPGRTATVTITLSRGSAPWDRYVTGSITWRSTAHSVRIPVAARPWGVTPEPYGDDGIQFGRRQDGAFGMLQPGFTGPLTGRSTGYTPMVWQSSSMPAGVNDGVFDPHASGVTAQNFTVPDDTAGFVVETATDDPNTNLDLYIYRGDTLVSRSIASWSSAEQVLLFMPEPGQYTAYVFAQKSGGPVVDYRLGHAIVGNHGNYAPATLSLPSPVQRGTTPRFTLKPDSPLPDQPVPNDEFWAYTELFSNGQTIPGPLVYTTQSSWQ
ncbi:hypothetical protein Raf01_88220 [Rugosimonospora africana]|uniref:Peptidase inhibitor I9 n=1 Tax=Rugosimonospora africana TaxID=556532 RepID=A0A8J3VVT2_9ACTN|nr:hypothetical protein Raf01_88220 [Rugosimonospora africana]